MNLSGTQRAMLDGSKGLGVQQAMRVLHAVGVAKQASDCIPVHSAHVGLSLSSLGIAGVKWLESLADSGAQVCVPTTTNVLSVDRETSAASAEGEADMQRRALIALARMGAVANCSCNPFSQGYLPVFGESVAWSESATAPFVNGVLGARTNREGATALASALTGVTPCYGMHRPSERCGRMLFRVNAAVSDLHQFHLLGVAVARRCAGKVPVLVGLSEPIGPDNLYGFCAALATYSSLAMFHMVGVTPEAPTLEAALAVGEFAGLSGRGVQNEKERIAIRTNVVEIGDQDLENERKAINQHNDLPVDMVVVGCPHASLAQLQEIAMLLEGRVVAPNKAFFVHTNAMVKAEAERLGLTRKLILAGVSLTSDTCAYVSLNPYPSGSRLLTDSSKMAFLMASRGLSTAVANTADCVRAIT